MAIKEFNIQGFRSLREVTWRPGALNVVIGPNGTGKSNLLRFLELISISARGGLGKYIQSLGGMAPIVWDGEARAISFIIQMDLEEGNLGPEQYELNLARLGGGSSYKIEKELLVNSYKQRMGWENRPFKFLERLSKSAVIFDEKARSFTPSEEYMSDEETLLSVASSPFINNHYIPPFQRDLASISLYHDLHTNKDAPIRQPVVSRLEERVEADGQNLISVLHTLYTSHRDFKKDIDSAMSAAFGDDFEALIFPPAADQRIQMRIRWKSSKYEPSTSDLSDGTLRFLFLLTALASPSPASIIAIDEPETGLHPSMLPIIAEHAVDASLRTQVIFTTHSPQFLDAFGETVPATTVAEWENGQTILKTLEGNKLDYWLKEYSLGSLYKSGELEQME